jgi:hypothetical protein
MHFAEGHWLASAGFAPTDVDALGRRPGSTPGHYGSLAFSIIANEGGVLDGDVLGLAPGGGVTVLVPESTLVTGLGASGANVDLDALDWDDGGRLLFSLQSDLSGTALGTVQDGDVLRLEADGSVSLSLAEGQVGAKLAAATGLSGSIGDVQGVTWSAGELWVAVQSPSAHDGSVLACGAQPAIVADEASLGLGGAELDALLVAVPGDAGVRLEIRPGSGAPGAPVTAEVSGGSPGGMQLVLISGGAGWREFGVAVGFGAFALDPLDPYLATWLTGAALPLVMLDAAGAATVDVPLPPAGSEAAGFGGELGWTYQTVDAVTLEVGAPFRVTRP